MGVEIAKLTRKRDDPRRAATRAALIEAAEQMFAESGVEAVSTRQIGSAIGALNTNVVAYHFGSKEGLIEAVFRHRLPDIDRRRGELLTQVDAEGSGSDLSALARVFALPLFEQTDSAGRHSYARFLNGLERSGMLAIRGQLSLDFPETDRLTSRMGDLLPEAAKGSGPVRMRLVFAMLGAALQFIDQDPELDAESARKLFDDATAMAAAAYAAPPATEG